MLVAFWGYRGRLILPAAQAQRQMWAVWLGYILSCVLLAVIVKLQFGVERLYDRIEYPYLTIMAGMAFFFLGSSYWGGCYAIALAYFVLAALMLLDIRWSVLEYGALWGAVLALIGWHLRRLGREG